MQLLMWKTMISNENSLIGYALQHAHIVEQHASHLGDLTEACGCICTINEYIYMCACIYIYIYYVHEFVLQKLSLQSRSPSLHLLQLNCKGFIGECYYKFVVFSILTLYWYQHRIRGKYNAKLLLLNLPGSASFDNLLCTHHIIASIIYAQSNKCKITNCHPSLMNVVTQYLCMVIKLWQTRL